MMPKDKFTTALFDIMQDRYTHFFLLQNPGLLAHTVKVDLNKHMRSHLVEAVCQLLISVSANVFPEVAEELAIAFPEQFPSPTG